MKNTSVDKYLYIALFEVDEETEGYTVTYPDLPGCITEGNNLSEAMKNAREALELHLFNLEEDEEEIPEPTSIEVLIKENSECIFVPIEAYMKSIRVNLYSKSTSKNVSLPYWLKKLAEKENINFSETLQEALREKLNISYLGIKDYKNNKVYKDKNYS
ncbi:type II toxin-antitoxin system HicB family antitoxin [Clostridium perfringens]|uniref:Type II toxin-antitoxin system HicB family antitoxin n=1 Tax=Clostridium perfringens TaxID=1502 RepID=A0A6G4ZDM6_CLOPF|nr:type II toxin-antitoxin system HicB family antitoxin [Clostridium perfringens]MCX0385638.1 type II toxin-antitoxin system HicB family antitoxin [Clostridium perfringens]MDK0700554.1 type II toxin-antitoxin system HicB family antitoxin [Clostridium perfringens]MDK0765210.1 type II toxin-antitoxin system HicB family antitoxin [Clostridium perfringens]MDM0858724.1 type II toxin-antitoxin system HicB family antitoxin [Clostridium perfringens]MDM0882332.1 type II toxin-antitoxin system HicB fami